MVRKIEVVAQQKRFYDQNNAHHFKGPVTWAHGIKHRVLMALPGLIAVGVLNMVGYWRSSCDSFSIRQWAAGKKVEHLVHLTHLNFLLYDKN